MWIILIPLMVLGGIVFMNSLASAGRHAETRRLTLAVEDRDRQIAELRQQLSGQRTRLNRIREHLGQLEGLFAQIEEQDRAGIPRLRLNRRGRLVEAR